MKIKSCFFCKRSSPEIKLTKEHILPKWMERKIKHEKEIYFLGNHRERPLGKLEDETVRNMSGLGPFSLTVSDVCGDCNNGWLSTLESEAKPILDYLINGRNYSLTRKDTCIISRWAIKTSMVRSLTDKGINTIPPSHIEAIVNGLIPDNTMVYIGCYTNKNRYFTRHQRFMSADNDRIYITTLCINSLFIQVIGAETDKLHNTYDHNYLESLEISHGKIHPLHPLKHGGIKWPFKEKLKTGPNETSGLIGNKYFNAPLLYEDTYKIDDGLYGIDFR
ncbi:Uncharacterised protein [Serratia rubidaea]|uniref:Uncharacterized protein n=1 Tax=Serratia rubidaea TaxID=61652 RepID=A0A3S4G1S8_SERRU|nr:Uncharacterised protein [Serratia rubidaea]